MGAEMTELEFKVAAKAALLQQAIHVLGLNMSSSTVAALRFVARMIEMNREQQGAMQAEAVRAELQFAVADSQRFKENR